MSQSPEERAIAVLNGCSDLRDALQEIGSNPESRNPRATLDVVLARLAIALGHPRELLGGVNVSWTDDPMKEARRIAEQFPDGLIAWLLANPEPAKEVT